jgi:UDP-N-acetylmuramoyl-L-alanyl-D-glutamate--2,6-diaminopimelate ligase
VGLVGTLGHELGELRWPASHTSPEADELMRIARAMQGAGATELVMEVSSIALAARRMDGVRFRVAAFTNLTQDHLDYHGTMDAYAEAKARLFTELGPSAVVLHVGDPFGRALRERIEPGVELVDYEATLGSTAAVHPVRVELGASGILLDAVTPRGEVSVRSPLIGAHNVENLLCAIAIALVLEVPLEAIARGLSTDVSVPGRLERCDAPGLDDVTVLVDYAHTPDALARVLDTVRPFTSGRVHCVFGCGGDRDPAKRPLMGEAAGRRADHCILTNDNPRSEDPSVIARAVVPGLEAAGADYRVELDRRAAIRSTVLAASPGDLVLVAGKGHETYQIVGDVTHVFDDRIEAKAALDERRRARAGEGIA